MFRKKFILGNIKFYSLVLSEFSWLFLKNNERWKTGNQLKEAINSHKKTFHDSQPHPRGTTVDSVEAKIQVLFFSTSVPQFYSLEINTAD